MNWNEILEYDETSPSCLRWKKLGSGKNKDFGEFALTNKMLGLI